MKGCALFTSLWKIWMATILFQQTKSYGGMKIWKFTLRRSRGVKNTRRQSQSLQSFSRKTSEKMKPCNSSPVIANAGAPRTTSTPSPSMSAFSAHLPQFRHDLQQQAFPELHLDSRISLLISTRIILQGHMEVNRNGKMSSGRTYNWHSICLRWSDLLMQDHTFLRHFME